MPLAVAVSYLPSHPCSQPEVSTVGLGDRERVPQGHLEFCQIDIFSTLFFYSFGDSTD